MTPLVTSTQLSPSPTTPIASLASTLVTPTTPITHAHLAAMYSPASYPDQPTPYSIPALGGEQSAFYSPAVMFQAAGLDLKDSLAGSPMAPTWPYPSMYYPYDSALASYPFAGYGMGLDAARRKNATREATATLKAWLNEHKKNPYPTKGEKIMLAIITKMTLTQVSTWFANARRRLKKENKMTWEPRSKTDDDDDEDDDKDDEKLEDKDCKDDDDKKDDRDSLYNDIEKEKKNGDRSAGNEGGSGSETGSGGAQSTDVVHPKPRIWSLADMATSGGLSGAGGGGLLSGNAGKIMGGSLTRGLHHIEGAPYARPLFPHSPYPYIPGSVSETLLSYSYAKSFPGFSPVSLGDMPHGLLASSPFVHDFSRHELMRQEISRPEAIRPELRLIEKDV